MKNALYTATLNVNVSDPGRELSPEQWGVLERFEFETFGGDRVSALDIYAMLLVTEAVLRFYRVLTPDLGDAVTALCGAMRDTLVAEGVRYERSAGGE